MKPKEFKRPNPKEVNPYDSKAYKRVRKLKVRIKNIVEK